MQYCKIVADILLFSIALTLFSALLFTLFFAVMPAASIE